MNDSTGTGLLRKPLAAALLPISILSDIVSLGTALAFSIVALLGGRRHSKLRGART
jgi:hypothetical protein